jgi:hypothetical protein
LRGAKISKVENQVHETFAVNLNTGAPEIIFLGLRVSIQDVDFLAVDVYYLIFVLGSCDGVLECIGYPFCGIDSAVLSHCQTISPAPMSSKSWLTYLAFSCDNLDDHSQNEKDTTEEWGRDGAGEQKS